MSAALTAQALPRATPSSWDENLDWDEEFALAGRGGSLRALPKPQRKRPAVVYGLIAFLASLTIAGAQLGLSIAMTEGGYEERALAQQQRALVLDRQEATDALGGLESPQYLAANAAALGMVTGSTPAYLRLSDGSIIGEGTATDGAKTVHASSGVVQNALLSQVPLAADPQLAAGGGAIEAAPPAQAPPASEEQGSQQPVIEAPSGPPVLEGGLPTPETH